MSEYCDKCNKPSDCTHPVGIAGLFSEYARKMIELGKINRPKLEELKQWERSFQIENWSGDTDPLTGAPDYQSTSPRLCHKCFSDVGDYIVWWG